MEKHNDILAPAEWMDKWHRGWESQEIGPEAVVELMNQYADYVAARVARNVRHRAAEIVADESGGNGTQCAESNARIYNYIMNIPLRDVYPAGQKETK